jgi:hypothetical protein
VIIVLPLCPNLRGLLGFGPIIRDTRSCEGLADLLRNSAPRHGFSLSRDGWFPILATGGAGRTPFLHEASTAGKTCVTRAVSANLSLNRDRLRRRISVPA